MKSRNEEEMKNIMAGESKFLDQYSSVDGIDSMQRLMKAEPFLNQPPHLMPRISQKFININNSNINAS